MVFVASTVGSILLFLGAALILLTQTLTLLNTGVWRRWSLFTLFEGQLSRSFITWLQDPQDGFPNIIIKWVFINWPLSSILFVLGSFCFLGGRTVGSQLEKRIRALKKSRISVQSWNFEKYPQ